MFPCGLSTMYAQPAIWVSRTARFFNNILCITSPYATAGCAILQEQNSYTKTAYYRALFPEL